MPRPIKALRKKVDHRPTNPLLEEDFWKTATPADVQQAIQQGAQVDARDQMGRTSLHYAALTKSQRRETPAFRHGEERRLPSFHKI